MRLVWNFELDTQNPLAFNQLPSEEKENLRWERRYFWSGDSMIKLEGLDNRFLNLSAYTLKSQDDTYFLLSDVDLNIKRRRGELVLKPLMEQRGQTYGFGQKIHLGSGESQIFEKSGSSTELDNLKRRALDEGKALKVMKETLTCKLPTEPRIKLELARLLIHDKVYFSVCVEGRSLLLVQSISNCLIKNHNSCDYVSFLKNMMTL